MKQEKWLLLWSMFSMMVGLCHTVRSELHVRERCNSAAKFKTGQTYNAAPKPEVCKIQEVVRQKQSKVLGGGWTPGRNTVFSGRVSDHQDSSQGEEIKTDRAEKKGPKG